MAKADERYTVVCVWNEDNINTLKDAALNQALSLIRDSMEGTGGEPSFITIVKTHPLKEQAEPQRVPAKELDENWYFLYQHALAYASPDPDRDAYARWYADKYYVLDQGDWPDHPTTWAVFKSQ